MSLEGRGTKQFLFQFFFDWAGGILFSCDASLFLYYVFFQREMAPKRSRIINPTGSASKLTGKRAPDLPPTLFLKLLQKQGKDRYLDFFFFFAFFVCLIFCYFSAT